MNDSIYENLTQLGGKTELPSSPDKAVLEKVDNPHPDRDYCIRFSCPEFTSLCPLTGQPDFAHLVIDYVPQLSLIESKSLKLYLSSFRNHGDFHEACTVGIAKDMGPSAQLAVQLNAQTLRGGKGSAIGMRGQ